MNKSSINYIIESVFFWWLGWLSLGLIEVLIRFTIALPSLSQMLLFTLLLYSLVGIILGGIFAIISMVIQRLFNGLKWPYSLVHFSPASCVSMIILLYALLFIIQVVVPPISLITIIKSIFLFSLSIAILFVLPFFFRWTDRKGKLLISYLSLLPSLWIITILGFNKNKGLLPPVFQVSTPFSILLLILGSIFCFVMVYFLLSMGKRFLSWRKGVPLFKPGLIILTIIFLISVLLFQLREEDYQPAKNEANHLLQGKPNIVLVTMDTVRADHLSCYGYQRLTTPNVDSFSREGVLFKNAYSTDSWTLPSHASIFTGKYPSKHGAHYNSGFLNDDPSLYTTQREKKLEVPSNIFKLSEENLTLAEILSAKGYRTAGIIGGNFCSSIFGMAQGFDFYNEAFLNVSKDIKLFLIYQVFGFFVPVQDIFAQYGYFQKRIASRLNNVALPWLEKNHDQPFFLFIKYFDAHRPYVPPPRYNRYFGDTDSSILIKHNPRGDVSYITAETNLVVSVVKGSHQLTSEEKEYIVSRYDGEIRYLDHYLGLLFEKLKALKIYDNTFIIITADHGEAFGEHGQMEHGKTLYEEVLHVPLIIKYPSAFSRKGVVEKKVSLVDIFPTVLSFLNYPLPTGIDGEILEKSNHPIIAENYASLWNVMLWGEGYYRSLKAVYQGQEKYIWSSNSLNELYDLGKDPKEEENLVKKFPHKAGAMQKTLDQWLASFKPPKTQGEKTKIDKSTEEGLRALGYIQ